MCELDLRLGIARRVLWVLLVAASVVAIAVWGAVLGAW